jgi:hypothetical protein
MPDFQGLTKLIVKHALGVANFFALWPALHPKAPGGGMREAGLAEASEQITRAAGRQRKRALLVKAFDRAFSLVHGLGFEPKVVPGAESLPGCRQLR